MPERVVSPVFVGRSHGLERLEAALVRLDTLGSQAILIGADAGMGKTRLLAEFAARKGRPSFRILLGGCLQMEGWAYPFAPFIDAFRGIPRTLGDETAASVFGLGDSDVAPSLPEVAHEPDQDVAAASALGRARLFERVLGLLDRLSLDAPLVLVLEDLHWADQSSLELLRFVVRNARRLPLLVIGTYRTDELEPRHPLRALLAELTRLEQVSSLRLPPFRREEVAAQVTAIRGDAPPGLIDALLSRSEGNPFFVEELLTVAGPDGRIDRMPTSLRETLLGRLAALSPEAREVVRVSAVAGRWIDEETIAAVLTQSSATGRALRDAVASNVLVVERRDAREGYAFRHGLLRDAAYEDLLPGERRRLHHRLADALALIRDRVPAVEWATARANHLYAALEFADALPAAIAAGLLAEAALAHAEALIQYERALELWPRVEAGTPLPIGRIDLLEHAAEAAMGSGARARGVALLQQAVDGSTQERDAMRAGILTERLSRYLNESGDWPTATVTLETALRRMAAFPPTTTLARALAEHGRNLALAGQLDEAETLMAEADAMARGLAGTTEPDLACRALIAYGRATCRLQLGDAGQALELVRPVRLDAMAAGHAQAMTELIGLESFCLDGLGHYDEVIGLAQAGRARLKVIGLDIRYGLGLMWRVAFSELRLGRWAEMERTVADTLAAGPMPDKAAGLHEARAILRARQGRRPEAWEDLLAWRALVSSGAISGMPQRQGAEVAVAELEGRWTDIRAIAARGIAAHTHPDTDLICAAYYMDGIRAEAEEAHLATLKRDQDRAAQALTIAEGHLAAMRHLFSVAAAYPGGASPTLRAYATLAEAEWSRVRGDPSPELWESAADHHEALRTPFDLAYARYREAEALLRTRRSRRAAAAHLGEAHRIVDELGATVLQDDIEALAQRARIDVGGHDHRRGQSIAGMPIDRLSSREREVLDLLMDGRSNREIGAALFITEKTASVHVTHILDKLGVNSRGAAAAVAARAGLAAGDPRRTAAGDHAPKVR